MKRLLSPLDVQIEVTEHCNERCRHCYNYWRSSDEYSEQEELGTDGFISIIDQLHKARIGLITFTGGEPMLRKRILFDLIAHARKCGIEARINSNATLINKDDALVMARRGLDHALISLLGPKELHHSITGPGGDFEGFGVDHIHAKLFPMHGTKDSVWKPRKSNIDKYFEQYEGYISSHDHKRADDSELAKLAKKIKGDS